MPPRRLGSLSCHLGTPARCYRLVGCGVPVRRLLLFDIDGTLVRAGEVGGAVFDRAIEAVLGEPPVQRVSMSGKTDPQIVREYLALLDRDDPAHLPAVLERLEAELAAASQQLARQGSPCAGAPELLQALAGDQRVHLSVPAGNIAPNAVVKLAAFGSTSGWTSRRGRTAATTRTASSWCRWRCTV